jgi:hypothetical protein
LWRKPAMAGRIDDQQHPAPKVAQAQRLAVKVRDQWRSWQWGKKRGQQWGGKIVNSRQTSVLLRKFLGTEGYPVRLVRV